MKKLKFLALLFTIMTTALITNAQTDFRSPDYHFWQQMSIGKGDGSATNPNAWLEIGKYGTPKGIILPRANVFNIAGSEGNFAFDINTKTLWFHNGESWKELLTNSDRYDSAYLKATYFPTTGILRLYRIDGDSTSMNIAQTLSLSGNTLSISGGNSVSLTTTNVAEGTNLYFTAARTRQVFTINNGLTYDVNTGFVKFGGSLLQNTNLDLSSYVFSIVNGVTNVFKTASDGTLTFGSYGSRNDAGFAGKVLFVDANGVVKSGITNFLTTETDPIFSASPAATITNTNISNWNIAYNKKINSIGFVPSTSILTLTQQDGSTLTTDLTHTHTATFTGDVTGTGTITGSIPLTIPNSSITYAKLQNITSARLLGRYSGTNGVAQEISLGTGLTLNSSTGVLSNSGVITESDPVALAKTITLTGSGAGISVTGGTQSLSANPSYTISNTATLQNVLDNGNIANNGKSPVLGATGQNAFYAYFLKQKNATMYIGNSGGTNADGLQFSVDNTVNPKQFLEIYGGASAPRYSSDNGTTYYDILHMGNHVPGSAFSPTLTGANVLASLVTNNAGHVTSVTTRTLSFSDVNAIANQTTLQTSANFNISGNGTIGTNLTVTGLSTLSNANISGTINHTGSYNFSTTPSGNFTLNLGSSGGVDATGDLYYRSAGGNLKQLNIGTAGQVLTVTGGLPSWQPAATSGGTVTSIGLTSSDITVGGTSPITTSGTFTLTLPNINSNVGTFNNVTVNAKGQVTAASNVGYLTSYTETDPIVSARTLTFSNGTGISITGGTQNLGANRTWTITNTAPDQVVTLNSGTGISVSGTYPNFTISGVPVTPTLDQVLTAGNSSTQTASIGSIITTGVNSGFPSPLSFGTNNSIYMTISATGLTNINGITNITKLGIGTNTPDENLDLRGYLVVGGNPAAFANRFRVDSKTGGMVVTGQSWSTGSSSWVLGDLYFEAYTARFGEDVAIAGKLDVTGNITTAGSITAAGGGFNSLRTLKKDISDFTGDALKLIDSLKIYNFKYKSNDKDDFIGMIIDEKNEVPKELLMKNGTAINTYNTIALLIKSIQQLNERLEKLEKSQIK